MRATYTKETSDFQQARIEALEKYTEMQQNLIDALTFRNDEIMFDYAEAKAKYNMLVRNIQTVDAINS